MIVLKILENLIFVDGKLPVKLHLLKNYVYTYHNTTDMAILVIYVYVLVHLYICMHYFDVCCRS